MTDTENRDPKWYRDQIEELRQENRELRSFRNSTIVEAAGLDPVVRKAVLKDIERGDFAGEMTAEGLTSWAKDEYDWEGPSPASSPAPEAPVSNVPTAEVQDGADRLASIQQLGTPPTSTPDRNSEIANKARQEGDMVTALRASMADQLEM